MDLPLTTQEISTAWLNSAINEWYPGTKVESFEIEKIIWGTATKILLRLQYGDGTAARLPQTICVKGGFDPKLSDMALAAAYQREANFYTELAPKLQIPLPVCLYAGVDAARGQGIVILDNLAHRGCSFGEPTEAWPVDHVAAGLKILAHLHGRTWGGATQERHPWIDSVTPVRQVAEVMLDTPYWDKHFASAEAPVVPAEFLDRSRMNRAFARLWQIEADEASCVLHGDPHIGNTYLTAASEPAFIDWQCVCAGPAIDDVTYFIGGALSIEDRRTHERGLLALYLELLAAAGGPKLALDAVWLNYRRFQVHGFLWATTGPMQQTPQRVAAISERHITAMEDLECLQALGV